MGRGLTREELERVLRRYPGDINGWTDDGRGGAMSSRSCLPWRSSAAS